MVSVSHSLASDRLATMDPSLSTHKKSDPHLMAIRPEATLQTRKKAHEKEEEEEESGSTLLGGARPTSKGH